MNIKEYWKENQVLLTMVSFILGYFLNLKFIHLPNVILFSVYSFVIGGYFFNEVDVYRLKFENTDWFVSLNFRDSATKIEVVGDWTLVHCGGINSNVNFITSQDGNTIVCVPTNSIKKFGSIYFCFSKVSYCSAGIVQLPTTIRNYVTYKKYDCEYFFGFSKTELMKFFKDGEKTEQEFTSNLVHWLQLRVNEQETSAIEVLGSFDKMIKKHTEIKENLEGGTRVSSPAD